MTGRLVPALRLAVVGAVVVAAAGAGGHLAQGSTLGAAWLTAALGPTAYVILTRPPAVAARLREGAVGHAAGIAAGLVALAVFGLWHAPSIAQTHGESWPQVGAGAVAIALTLLVLTLTGDGHAPAAATALLVASGIAGPGKPLAGLVAGLVIVLVLSAVLAGAAGQKRSGSASAQSDAHDAGGSASSSPGESQSNSSA